jgi:hypothetical protein
MAPYSAEAVTTFQRLEKNPRQEKSGKTIKVMKEVFAPKRVEHRESGKKKPK